MFSCSPVGTLRSTKNWVHIPLKEISDANKLFCARCSGYRVAPKTKLWVTSLTSTKFVFLLTGRHRARRGWLSRFSVDFWTGAARNRKKGGIEEGPAEQQWDWVRSLWTIELESQSAAFFFYYYKHALSSSVFECGSNLYWNVWYGHTLLWLFVHHRPSHPV